MDAALPYLLPLVPAVVMMRSDIRRRRVDIRWLAAFAAGAVTIGIAEWGVRDAAIYCAANVGILCAMLCVLGAFYGFRRLFIHCFGAGDALFFAAAAPVFQPKPYVCYLIATFACGTVWGLVSRRRTVPLVGVACCTFIVVTTARLWTR